MASSDKAYGDQLQLPYTEDAPLQGRHPYDASKSCADILALTYHQTYDLPVCVTRCGNFYGGGDLNWNRIVPGTIRAALRGQRPVIRSDGTFVRDYFYVKDGAAAYLHLAECMARQPEVVGQAFNFSNEIQVTVLELVSRILRLMHSPLQPEVRGEASNEIKHQYLSAAKARRMLGWNPRYTLDVALAGNHRLVSRLFRRALGRPDAAGRRRAPAARRLRNKPSPTGVSLPCRARKRSCGDRFWTWSTSITARPSRPSRFPPMPCPPPWPDASSTPGNCKTWSMPRSTSG